MIKYNGQLKEAIFNIRKVRSHKKKTEKSKPDKEYCDDIFTFDIETSSAWLDEDGNVIEYVRGKSAEYWNSLVPVALPYIWQFSFNDTVYYGREFTDFLQVLNDLPEVNIKIWVHNLAFEHQFLTNILTWDKVFAKTPHKPMYSISKEYPHITFCCSYFLTNMSLATWGNKLGLPKMVGDLDYEKLRTPLYPIEDHPEEMQYCKRDCEIVYLGIKDYLTRYKDQWDIPMTSTGTVRRVVKEMLTEDPYYVKWLKKLVPSAEMYQILLRIFAGGYTHANRYFTGSLVDNKVYHWDFASSYPTWMIAGKYPSTPFVLRASHIMPDRKEFDDKAFIFHLRFKNIQCQTFNTYIQSSKCSNMHNCRHDNGRLLSGDFDIMITEQDWMTIEETYTWDSMEVLNIWYSNKDYHPVKYADYILQLYYNKTALKAAENETDKQLYALSKTYINSLYGMEVTSLCQSDVELDANNEWHIKQLTLQDVKEKLQKLKHYNPREKRYFLNFAWGCWVTAYSRRALWMCVIPNDEHIIYMDTDSCFADKNIDFTWYNNYIDGLLKKACKYYKFDFERTRPADPKGIKHPLGHFTPEETDDRFITLGAKRYIEERDGKLYLTVAGINKDAVELIEDIEDFKDGFEFDKDADCVKKRLCTYISCMPDITYPDGYVSKYRYGINLRRTGYKLGISDEYAKLIELTHFDMENLPEHIQNRLKGYWQ